MGEKVDPNRDYNDIPDDSNVVAKFNHEGHPFRITFTKNNGYSAIMRAYSGATGEMNSRNHIETKYVSTYRCTLHDCIARNAKARFDINPTDIEFTVTPP